MQRLRLYQISSYSIYNLLEQTCKDGDIITEISRIYSLQHITYNLLEQSMHRLVLYQISSYSIYKILEQTCKDGDIIIEI
jgi:DNA-binding PadR family transcriptional regulator